MQHTPCALAARATGITGLAADIHKAFRLEAVIDWIELEVIFQAPEEFKWVRRALRKLLEAESVSSRGLYVRGQGSSGDVRHHAFRFRLHDAPANSPSMLLHILDGLAAWRAFAQRASITAIEISLDFWPKAKAAPLVAATKTLQGMMLGDGGVPRQVINDRRAYSLDDFSEILDGASVYIGNQESRLKKGIIATPYAWRTYLKVTDNNKRPLPPAQHRPRVEVTLQGAALQELYLTNPYELANYPFRKLAKLFRFRRMLPLLEILRQFDTEAELCKSTKAMILAESRALRATGIPPSPAKMQELRHRVALARTIRNQIIKLYQEGAHALTWQATGWTKPSGNKKQSVRANKSRSTESYDELNDRAAKALHSLEQSMKKG